MYIIFSGKKVKCILYFQTEKMLEKTNKEMRYFHNNNKVQSVQMRKKKKGKGF